MAEVHAAARAARQPDREPSAGAAGAPPARGGPRRGGRVPRPRPGRHRLHLGRHRVGQPGRARVRPRPPCASGARRSCCPRRWSTRRCASPRRAAECAGADARELPVDGAGVARPRRAGPRAVLAGHAGRGHGGQQRDRRGAAGRRRGRRGAPARPAGVRVHRRRAGRPLARPGRGRRRRRPGVAERAQGRRARSAWARSRSTPGVALGTAPARRRAGARAAQRDPGRGGRGRAGHGAAPGGGRARGGRDDGSRRCATGWRTGCSAGVEGALAPCRRASTSCPATSTCASRASSARSCWWRSAAEGVCVSGGSSCASGALEPSHVLAAMGVSPGLAAGAVRFSLGYAHHRRPTWTARCRVVPGVVAALRRRA